MSVFDLFRRTPDFRKLCERNDRKRLEKLLSHKSAYCRWRALVTLVSLSRKHEYDAAVNDFITRDEAGSLKQLGDFLGFQSEPGFRVLAIEGIPVNYGLEWSERSDVVKALARVTWPAAVPLFIHALRDPDEFVRMTTAQVLSEFPYEPSKDNCDRLTVALVPLLAETRYAVRIYAVEALGRFGSPAVLPSVQAIAKDRTEDRDMRRTASEASSRIKVRAAEERL